jgi:hypothetical protein
MGLADVSYRKNILPVCSPCHDYLKAMGTSGDNRRSGNNPFGGHTDVHRKGAPL